MNMYDEAQMNTEDPKNMMNGKPVPALTTLLYAVCDGNHDKFNEAIRLVELFMRQAVRMAGK